MKLKQIIQIGFSIAGIIGSLFLLKKRFASLKEQMITIKDKHELKKENG
ncbi:hypothetical protein [Paucilactobacillus wasatchensis]|uniref:Uncharacterized protein n=1 Tax=Paucilactobacillus wasatchensis TaxID=1335616 RepID=A0A0D1A949_9LACO|nr:hypothetical protein [Paucilactobacillus wasatchensis]KIS04350.1 hypothetical protein WDC_0087 [Paucilactobacillus wasatchensis]